MFIIFFYVGFSVHIIVVGCVVVTNVTTSDVTTDFVDHGYCNHGRDDDLSNCNFTYSFISFHPYDSYFLMDLEDTSWFKVRVVVDENTYFIICPFIVEEAFTYACHIQAFNSYPFVNNHL